MHYVNLNSIFTDVVDDLVTEGIVKDKSAPGFLLTDKPETRCKRSTATRKHSPKIKRKIYFPLVSIR